ncbi:hypothetical protein CTI12_AA495280 [Artemisia annua]|uniref:Uncharacterized protein n=1 Tax=Artemisia annua TaxID=35608 RepID=A0A2U1L992_ARTAN|nr:hypothetical protein CTI12_AA495280 [Artemisia annua]
MLIKRRATKRGEEIVDENVGVEMDNDDISNGDDDGGEKVPNGEFGERMDISETGKVGNRAHAAVEIG